MKSIISISLLALVSLLAVGCNESDSSNDDSDTEPLKRASLVKLSDFTVDSEFLSRADVVQEINYQDDFYFNEPLSGSGSGVITAEDKCFLSKYEEAYSSNTFKKNVDGTFYLDIPKIDYSECITDGETFKVSRFLDDFLVVDYNGALVDIEGKTLYTLPSNTYIKQQRSITTMYLTWTYQDVEIVDNIIKASVGLNGFKTPCELKSPVQCSYYETTDTKFIEADGEEWGIVDRSVLTANTTLSNGNDMFYNSGTIDFTINNWSGIMSYTGANNYPTYVANSDSDSVSGTF